MQRSRVFVLAPMIFLLAAGCSVFGGGGGGGAMLKSTDAGENWDFANKAQGEGTIAGVTATRVRLDPNKQDELYLATSSSGVYQSTDQAGTWKNILTGPKIYDFQVNPGNSDELFAGGTSGELAKAFRSQDHGQTWIEVYSEAKAATFVSAIAYHPKDNKIVFLGLSTGEIIRSVNGGESWNLFAKLKDRVLRIEVEPEDARLIFALSFNSGLSRSTDGGATWQSVTDKKVNVRNFQDFRTIRGAVSNLYLATGDGLWFSSDRGDSWNKLSLPLHEPTSIVSAIEVNQHDPAHVYASIGHTMYLSSDSGRSWKTKALATTATIRDLALDQKQLNILFAALGVPLQ